jgi:hypothetical protein
LPRANLEVVLAFRAHIQIGFKIRLENCLTAAQALDPQTLGANPPFGRVSAVRTRARLVLAVITFEP